MHTQHAAWFCVCRSVLLTQTSCWLRPALQRWPDLSPAWLGAGGFLKTCRPAVITLCNYWHDCCFPDKGCLPVWYYFCPEVCSSRKAMSTRHNTVRKQTLPDTTRDLLAKSDTDLTGEQPHGLTHHHIIDIAWPRSHNTLLAHPTA